jgi:hypothetical protein
MGDSLARQIEKKIKKPKGWMDALDDELTKIDAETMDDASKLHDLDERDKRTVRALIGSLLEKKHLLGKV